MQRYYLHIVDGRTVRDEEGQDFETLEDARNEAIASARSIMREALWKGKLPLNERIEITDDNGVVLLSLPFSEAVQIER